MFVPALLGLLATSHIVAASSNSSNTTCNDIQLFLVRGHGESIPGNQATVASAVCAAHPSLLCGYQSVAYNATDDNSTTICTSQRDGVLLAKADLAAYATACPDAKLVLAGWSQGGALVTDVLAGGGGIDLTGTCTQEVTEPLGPEEWPGTNVVAVVTYGELHHNANQSWNVGNGSVADGLYPRTTVMLEALGLWGDRFRDYCVVEDPACAAGAVASSHYSYFEDEWVQKIAGFIGERLGA